MAFVKASRVATKLRLALSGPAGSGKTRSALEISRHLTPDLRIAVVDTEQGSASKYADVGGLDFDVMEIRGNYHPKQVATAIADAAAGGYGVVIFDSLTHFWNGPGGFLQLVDDEVARMKARGGKPDSFAAWKVVDPIYKQMVQDLLNAPIHVIVTLRAKTEYEKTDNGKGGTKIQKVGMAPEIRDTFQYEMDVEGTLDMDHTLVIGKTRIDPLDGRVFKRAGKDFADIYHHWAASGVAPVRAVATVVTVPPLSETVQNVLDAYVDEAMSDITRIGYANRIAFAATPEELRSILPGMKSSYPSMTPEHVESLRAAYTERSNALKTTVASKNGAEVVGQ